MLLSLVLESLDAELNRLERLRMIVADLAAPVEDVVTSAGVSALLARPQMALAEVPETPSAPVGSARLIEEEKAVAPRKRKARRVAEVAEPAVVRTAEGVNAAQVPGPGAALPVDDASLASRDAAQGAENKGSSAVSAPQVGAEAVVSRPKPAMVVVSATEAARDRESRAARQPAKHARGEHKAAKPDAAPEDLARDLAARWLSGHGGATELRGR